MIVGTDHLDPSEPVAQLVISSPEAVKRFRISADGSFTFFIDGDPTLRLEKGFFHYRGEKIEDIHQAYERFRGWMDAVLYGS